MLKKIETSDLDTVALEAKGKITASDYSSTLIPIFDKARSEGRKIRFLFYIGPEYEGFTLGAGWEDMKLGFKHLRVLERCAVVSDITWIREMSDFFGSLMPCPVKVFKNTELSSAKKWLDAGEIGLDHFLDTENGVLRIDISGPLTSQNFEVLTHKVDEWIDSEGLLNGLVIHVKKFPGWEDLGSFWSHMTFIKNHHRKIRKVAFCVDGELADIATTLAGHFVEAEINVYKYDKLPEALRWAAEKLPS